MRPLAMLPIGFGLLALLFIVLAVDAWRRRRRASGVLQVLIGVIFGAFAAIGGLLAVGTAGYQALTRETVAATATVTRLDAGEHRVSMRFPDGTERDFMIRGDELYVDAEILKWHPMANVVGLHTGYALDRIAGRYRELADEREQPRTVHSLGAESPVDLFAIIRRYPFLSGFVDATYGSGTFAPLEDSGRYEVRVSTTGLLIRSLETQRP